MEIIIIAALTKNRVIGKDNTLIWHIPEDMKLFRTYTRENTVIMGRKTYDSMGRALPNRNNIVITNNNLQLEDADVVHSCDEAIEKAKEYGKDIFIIGGGKIYSQFLDQADKLYLSWVKKDYEGDAHFPEFNQDDWKIVRTEEYDDFTFIENKR